MKVLVTGATGFLGAATVKRLLLNDEVEQVICLARDQVKAAQIKQNVENIQKLIFLHQDLHSLSMTDLEIDAVIHAASVRNLDYCNTHPKEAVDVNVEGLRRLLELSKKKNVRKWINVSSWSVYGDPMQHIEDGNHDEGIVLREDMNCYPSGTYALTKYIGEVLTQNILSGYALYVSVRCSRFYGMGLFRNPDNFMTNHYPLACLHGGMLNIKGNGRQGLDILHIDDAARFIETMLIHPSEKVWDTVYNIGSGAAISILAIAEHFHSISAKMGYSDVEIFVEEPDALTPKHFWLDIQKAKDHLNWSPKIELKQGIYTTLEAIIHAELLKSQSTKISHL